MLVGRLCADMRKKMALGCPQSEYVACGLSLVLSWIASEKRNIVLRTKHYERLESEKRTQLWQSNVESTCYVGKPANEITASTCTK